MNDSEVQRAIEGKDKPDIVVIGHEPIKITLAEWISREKRNKEIEKFNNEIKKKTKLNRDREIKSIEYSRSSIKRGTI